MTEQYTNGSAYSREFHSVLMSVVGSALSLDDFIAAAEFCALCPPAEIFSAASAARDAGLPVDEGVGYFLLCICAETQTQTQSATQVALLRPGASSKLSAIIDYAIPILLGEKGLNQDVAEGFTQKYVHRKRH
jgi:hypothetical protein